MTYGFIGLGQMGKPMALNLARKHDVLAYDTRADIIASTGRIQQIAKIHGLSDCECIFLSLPSAKVLEAVLFGRGGLIGNLAPGTVIVDTSTVEYNATVDVASRVDKAGLRFVDAPVSGMQSRAEDGTLTMMCGGDPDLVETLRAPCSLIASKFLYMGPVGSGQLTKLINQLLFDINMAALAEILPVAAKLGLDPELVGEVVNSGTGRSYAAEFFIPNILKGEFGQGYPMAAAYKDLVSGAELSARQALPMPVLAAATTTYQRALAEGHGAKDKGAMILVFEKLLGTRFRVEQDPEVVS
jgi:3-hydroxyisobutyrate dehydrogenase-like beta-hydroxyacid dehydrogenase